MARVKKNNIERVVDDTAKDKYITDGWEEVKVELKTLKIDKLRALATSKDIQFDPEIKKEDLLKLLEGAE